MYVRFVDILLYFQLAAIKEETFLFQINIKDVYLRSSCKKTDFKGTVMQTEKALINDSLRVSKVS